MKIPVFEPDIGAIEIEAVAQALRRGELSGTFGQSLETFESEFAKFSGCKHGVAVSSGTTALHLAIAALELEPGDEVLVSASTNIASALAIYHNGCIPVPVDSEPSTWNLNLELIESLITPRTRAIMPVHLFGHPVDMDVLNEIAQRHKLAVIEDCAEAHGAKCHGKVVGGLSDMGCFSFYANKIITTGEGGMVTTNSDALADKLRLLRNLAFTKPRFRHELAGYNFRMTGYQAAMGLAQFRRIEGILKNKRRMAASYTEKLRSVKGLQLPTEKAWAFNVYWMYGIVLNKDFPISRDQLVVALADIGIETRTFFCPMNLQPFLQKQEGYRFVDCPVANNIWENGLYLPSSHTLEESKLSHIASAIQQLAA